MTTEDVFILDVLKSVADAMIVPKADDPLKNYHINFEPGNNEQIVNSLMKKDGSALQDLKYPLLACVMPITVEFGSGFAEVTFPRIVFAYLTKTGDASEPVLDKYVSNGVFKKILRPCRKEFIKQLAFSTHTNMGDPDAYSYKERELPAQQPISEGVNDYVDIVEILNLKANIFYEIKTC